MRVFTFQPPDHGTSLLVQARTPSVRIGATDHPVLWILTVLLILFTGAELLNKRGKKYT
jgi:hypothetical protein